MLRPGAVLLHEARFQLPTPAPASISLGDVRFHANTECFQGSVPLLPHLCPLSVAGGIFGKPLKMAI